MAVQFSDKLKSDRKFSNQWRHLKVNEYVLLMMHVVESLTVCTRVEINRYINQRSQNNKKISTHKNVPEMCINQEWFEIQAKAFSVGIVKSIDR